MLKGEQKKPRWARGAEEERDNKWRCMSKKMKPRLRCKNLGMNKTRGGICLHQNELHYTMIKNSPLLSGPSNTKGSFFMKIPLWSGRRSSAVIPVPRFIRQCKTKAWFWVCGDKQSSSVLGVDGNLVSGNTSNGSHSKVEGNLRSEDSSKLGWRPI